MSAHATSRAAAHKAMMPKGRRATRARASRAVTRAGRFEAERTYIMIKCVWSSRCVASASMMRAIVVVGTR